MLERFLPLESKGVSSLGDGARVGGLHLNSKVKRKVVRKDSLPKGYKVHGALHVPRPTPVGRLLAVVE